MSLRCLRSLRFEKQLRAFVSLLFKTRSRRWKLQTLKKGLEVSSIAALIRFQPASNSPIKRGFPRAETNSFSFSFPEVSSFQTIHAKMETSAFDVRCGACFLSNAAFTPSISANFPIKTRFFRHFSVSFTGLLTYTHKMCRRSRTTLLILSKTFAFFAPFVAFARNSGIK